jgi:CDP-2,3-bis-(O-geranylgeranyl)-sn-glycerol synthase
VVSNGMNILFDAFWFFLPAGIANMSPVFAAKIPFIRNWKTPIDLGKTQDGHRILGDNKTWRGLAFGTFIGAFVCILQQMVLPEYSLSHAVVIGAAQGAGALVGDAAESFFKRRHGIRPGNAWFPFDQTDYIIGGLLFVSPFVPLYLELILFIFVLYFGLHLLASYVGYLVGFKDKPI